MSPSDWKPTRLNLGLREKLEKEMEVAMSDSEPKTMTELNEALIECRDLIVVSACKYADDLMSFDVLKALVQNYQDALKVYEANTQKVFYWPDYEWCFEEDLEEMQEHSNSGTVATGCASAIMTVSTGLHDDDIDAMVRKRLAKDIMVQTF